MWMGGWVGVSCLFNLFGPFGFVLIKCLQIHSFHGLLYSPTQNEVRHERYNEFLLEFSVWERH